MMIKPHIVSYLIMSQQREFTRFVTRLTRRVSLKGHTQKQNNDSEWL
jgi:hypothetical protein